MAIDWPCFEKKNKVLKLEQLSIGHQKRIKKQGHPKTTWRRTVEAEVKKLSTLGALALS